MKPQKDARGSDTPVNSQTVLELGGREGALQRSSCDYSSTPEGSWVQFCRSRPLLPRAYYFPFELNSRGELGLISRYFARGFFAFVIFFVPRQLSLILHPQVNGPMNRYRNAPGLRGPSKASANTLCQKCLKRDMWP